MSIFSQRRFNLSNFREKKSYLNKNTEGKVRLMRNHSYYYQVQTQLLVTGFFVWTEEDGFLETIRVHTEIQAYISSKTKPRFCTVLLPKVVGKYFTNSTNSEMSQDKWCICRMSEDKDHLIMCVIKTCKI